MRRCILSLRQRRSFDVGRTNSGGCVGEFEDGRSCFIDRQPRGALFPTENGSEQREAAAKRGYFVGFALLLLCSRLDCLSVLFRFLFFFVSSVVFRVRNICQGPSPLCPPFLGVVSVRSVTAAAESPRSLTASLARSESKQRCRQK